MLTCMVLQQLFLSLSLLLLSSASLKTSSESRASELSLSGFFVRPDGHVFEKKVRKKGGKEKNSGGVESTLQSSGFDGYLAPGDYYFFFSIYLFFSIFFFNPRFPRELCA